MGVAVEKSKVTYIHIYCFSLIAIPFFVGILEYIVICSGQNCTIDGYRLWRWLLSIILFFIPITLCIWSEFVNGFIRGIFHKIQTSYEEKTLFFAILILVALFAASLTIFNIYWNQYVGNDVFENKNNYSKFGKEYMAALVNLSVFVATIYAPIAALILYDNWKVQHNKKIISDEAKKLLVSVDKEILEFSNIVSNLKRLDPNKRIQAQYDELFSQAVVRFNQTIDNSDNISYLVSELSDDKKFENIRIEYNSVTINLQNKFTEQLKNDVFPTEILNTFQNIRKDYLMFNKLYKTDIKRLIFA